MLPTSPTPALSGMAASWARNGQKYISKKSMVCNPQFARADPYEVKRAVTRAAVKGLFAVTWIPTAWQYSCRLSWEWTIE